MHSQYFAVQNEDLFYLRVILFERFSSFWSSGIENGIANAFAIERCHGGTLISLIGLTKAESTVRGPEYASMVFINGYGWCLLASPLPVGHWVWLTEIVNHTQKFEWVSLYIDRLLGSTSACIIMYTSDIICTSHSYSCICSRVEVLHHWQWYDNGLGVWSWSGANGRHARGYAQIWLSWLCWPQARSW